MGILLKTTTHDIQMKTISLALVLATALGLKINEAATTTTDQHQINNLYNNSTVNSADDTIEPI